MMLHIPLHARGRDAFFALPTTTPDHEATEQEAGSYAAPRSPAENAESCSNTIGKVIPTAGLTAMPLSDVITLENLEQKLPRWDPASDSHLYAIVDMGSNGIRFSITSLEPPSTRLLRPVYSTRAPISLFDALTPSETGLVFSDSTITSVAATLADFHRQALMYGVPQANIMILATEAMRRAANGGRMLEAIEKSTKGLGVHILDPAVETLCGAVMGSRSGLGSLPERGALFLDLGGGSVQMTWVDPSASDYEILAARSGVSLPFGAARLIRVLKQGEATVVAEQTGKLSSGLSEAYNGLCRQFPRLQALREAYQNREEGLVDVYMCGGGFRGYGSMLMHTDEVQPYPFSTVNGYSVLAARFKDTDRMRSVHEDLQDSIFGLSSRRREQFPAILTVIEAFINAVPNIRSVTFCGGSNREGALMMKLPLETRESNPLEALASVKDIEKPVFDAVAQILRDAMPDEPSLARIPTVFSTGLTSLVIRETWSRQGHDADSNTSFALRNAIIRDTDAPGLSHRVRALLALTLSARWSGSLSAGDAQLSRSLQAIVDREHPGASFWAFYIGGHLRVLADIFPVLPLAADQLRNGISLQGRIQRSSDKKDRVSSTISIHPSTQIRNAEKMAKKLKEVVNSVAQKQALKFEAEIIIKS